jgi:hypothetical protein
MSDGTGRAAEFECHPDERVEGHRWLICEAEVPGVSEASAGLQMIRCWMIVLNRRWPGPDSHPPANLPGGPGYRIAIQPLWELTAPAADVTRPPPGIGTIAVSV